MSYSELYSALDAAASFHTGQKETPYFGNGPKEAVDACKRVIFLLKAQSSLESFKTSKFIAYQPLFPVLKNHIDQIRQNYQNSEEQLLLLLLKCFIPQKLNPLSFKVLSQVSLCSTPVQLNSERFNPPIITAFVDGFYDFVIPIGSNLIRIPLIPKDGVTPVSLPPSIRFIGNEKERKNAQDFVVNRAVKIGRIYQFNTFVSILSRSNPKLGPLAGFKDALTSFDLTFATAICTISYNDRSKQYIPMLINLLGCVDMLDHFIRVLVTCSRLAVSTSQSEENTEFISLANIFNCSSFDWNDVYENDQMTIKQLIKILSTQKLRQLPELSKYVLKAALVVACYQDTRGDVAIFMFMELFIRPFVKKLYLDADYLDEKEKILKRTPQADDSSEYIKRAIIEVLGMDVDIMISPSRAQQDLGLLYDFALSRVDELVRLIILLNRRSKQHNPILQTLVFAYKISLDNEIETDSVTK